MPDQIIRCRDCGTDFIFDVKEQAFFERMQFKNRPKRCKPCRGVRRAESDREGRTDARKRAIAQLDEGGGL